MVPLVAVLAGGLVFVERSRRQRALVRQLRDARAELDRLRATDGARIRFFGNIAHELRTPLSLILAQIDAALTESAAEARERQLRVAARNARRLHRIADQALELTRLDAGVLDPVRRELEVVPFLESLVLSFGELAERHGILLEFVARPRSIRCRLDSDQLTTIVTNLLSNALKYTPAGGRIGVAVETRPAPRGYEAGDRLAITVADTGPGIPSERQEAIFERFVRAEEADREDRAGAGIGLALARELARIHGGTITVRSEPGRGARFVVELPLGHAAEASSSPPLFAEGQRPEITAEMLHRTTGAGGESETASEPERPTILVVEDHPDFRAWLADELAGEGRIAEAADGSAALAAARTTLPDLIVSDVRMAGVDGLELCRQIRADERTSHIPIILVSVQSSVDRRVEGSEAGADEFLAKPVDGRELRARAAGLMASRRALRERFREQVVIKPSDVSPHSADQRFLERLLATVEAQLGDAEFSVSELAGAMAMSTSQLTRKLAALIDQTPGKLIRSMRLERAAALVTAGTGTMAEIAYQVGFSDQAHFSRSFKRRFGQSPVEYRKQMGERSVSP